MKQNKPNKVVRKTVVKKYTANKNQNSNSNMLSQIRKFFASSKSNKFVGFKSKDKNVRGNILLVANEREIYSFIEKDILSETALNDGRVSLEIARGSVAILSKPFLVGNQETNFLNLTENLNVFSEETSSHLIKKPNEKDIESIRKTNAPKLSLASVATYWNNSCALQDAEVNNCAHFLSDAFIRAGYSELKKINANPLITLYCDWNVPQKTGDARPVRALDMKNWFNSKATERETTIQSNRGFWAVYQERQSDGQGHVLLYNSDSRQVYGTLDPSTGVPYFFSTWLQFFYKW